MRWPTWPLLPAESLRLVREPGALWLRAGPVRSPAEAARSMARALAADRASDPAPAFLTPQQAPGFQRVLAAVRRHRGALLAEPVGSGKTWIALAAAQVLQGSEATPVIAPAALRGHWERTARRVGVPIRFASTAAASRGHLPPPAGFAILDESHHFRTRSTARYRHVARWLTGRCAVLLSATPVINRLDDLAAQLRLVVRDDALAPSGVGSLDVLLGAGQGDAALADLIVASPAAGRPAAARHTLEPPDPEPDLLRALDGLTLSAEAPVAGLVRQVLLRALDSSPRAFLESITSYHLLLEHAAQATRSGRQVDRALIRQFAGADALQCVMWELVASEGAPVLSLSDEPLVAALTARARELANRDDGKVTLLRQVLDPAHPTLVFTGRRATVRYLRDRLIESWPAWCAGPEAGVGPLLAPRSQVLDWFRADAPEVARLPTLLLATDVASEGLDLARLTRVVHYDLPWTPARLEQREGRSRRGPARNRVESWAMRPSGALAARLDLEGLLRRKDGLPSVVDVGDATSGLWRWREAVAAAWGTEDAPWGGCAVMEWVRPAVLAVLQVVQHGAAGDMVTGRVALLVEPAGITTTDPTVITEILSRAVRLGGAEPAASEERQAAMALVAPHARELLRRHEASAWWRRATGSRQLVARLTGLARRARLARDRDRLRQLECALHAAGGGRSAGEDALAHDLEQLDDDTLAQEAWRLGGNAGPPVLLSVRLAGLLILRAGSLPFPGAQATFAAHDSGHPALRP